MDLRELKLERPIEETFPFKELQRLYDLTQKRLISAHPEECETTKKERDFYKLLRSRTKMKIHKSFWIGKRCVDLFIPCLKGDSSQDNQLVMQGLIIEIDGDIHNKQFKTSKDNSKYHFVHKLRIATYTVENHDLNEATVKSLLNQLSECPKLDARGRKRLMQKVYLATLAWNLSRFNLSEELSENQVTILHQVKSLLRKKW